MKRNSNPDDAMFVSILLFLCIRNLSPHSRHIRVVWIQFGIQFRLLFVELMLHHGRTTTTFWLTIFPFHRSATICSFDFLETFSETWIDQTTFTTRSSSGRTGGRRAWPLKYENILILKIFWLVCLLFNNMNCAGKIGGKFKTKDLLIIRFPTLSFVSSFSTLYE